MQGPLVFIGIRKAEGLSGAAIMVRRQIESLVAQGFCIHLAAERLDTAWAAQVGIRWSRLPCPWWRRGAIRERFAAWAERQAARLQPDLVVGHGDLRQQDVLHLHNLVHRAHRILTGRPLAADDALGHLHTTQLRQPGLTVIANSQMMATALTEDAGLPQERIRLLHPGFDATAFTPADAGRRQQARRTLGLPDDRPVLGLIASGDLHKRGADLLLAALAQPALAILKPLTVIVGKERHPERWLAHAPTGAEVRFLPPRPDVATLYDALDALAAPARIEEFGMCVLEAAAAGLPIVVSATTGAAKALEHLPRVTVVSDLSPGPLGAALAEALVQGRQAAPDLGALAWPAHGKALAEIYRERLTTR